MVGIITNAASLNAQNNLSKSSNDLQTSLQRLSSGLRINSAKDDAAGLAISNRMTSQINGLNQAVRNANDGISMAQVAEGAMDESTNILQRMRELSIQSANASNSASDRESLQSEVSQLQAELSRIATTTRFGDTKLLDGNFTSKSFQVGAQANETISISIGSAKAEDLGYVNNVSFTGFSSSAATASNATPASGVTGQTLTFAVDGTTTDVSIAAGSSAAEIADATNANVAGVRATATTGARIDAATGVEAGDTIDLNINGEDLTGLAVTDAATASSSIAAAIQGNAALSNLTVTDNGDGTVDIRDASGNDISITYTNGTDTTGDNAVSVQALDATDTLSGSSQAITSTQGTVVTGDIAFTTTQADATLALSSSDGAGGITTATTAGAGGGTSTQSTTRVSDIDISSVQGSQSALEIIDAAIGQIDSQRADLGAIQNRLESTISNLSSIGENVSAARGRIMDTDFAAETANLTKNQILQQAGTAMLAQANSLPQGVLSLLQ